MDHHYAMMAMKHNLPQLLEKFEWLRYGKTTRRPGSFTFEMTPEQASKYLTLPVGKRLNEKS
jgi:hypothetical protein